MPHTVLSKYLTVDMAAPLIAIVGRPNVGKSTLFNRLSGGSALVADLPGVTRDCLHGEGQFQGRPYQLWDTSGLPGIPARVVPEDSEIAVQAYAAERTLERIRDADVLLLLVDARAGPLPADAHLAEQLRKFPSSCFLVVNKAEGMEPELAAAEFHALGVGRPYPISALHGTGVDTLLEALFESVETPLHSSALDADEIIPGIVVIGRPNVGKSTLVNRILREDRMLTSAVPGTTRDNVASKLKRAGMRFQLIDTPGIRRRSRLREDMDRLITRTALSALDRAHLVVLVISAEEGVTEQDARLAGRALELGGRLVIAVNKWDRLARGERDANRAAIGHELRFASGARIHYVSALKGLGMSSLCTELDCAGNTRVPGTAALCRQLHAAVTHRPPPVIGGRRIRLLYAHAGGWRPLRVIIHGRGDGLPASYRRYLANRLREAFKLPGYPIRIEYIPARGRAQRRGKRGTLASYGTS